MAGYNWLIPLCVCPPQSFESPRTRTFLPVVMWVFVMTACQIKSTRNFLLCALTSLLDQAIKALATGALRFLPQTGTPLAQQAPALAVDLGHPEPVCSYCCGKPATVQRRIQFNLSHCQKWCAVAWSATTRVGVDVELIRPVPGMTEIIWTSGTDSGVLLIVTCQTESCMRFATQFPVLP